MTTSKPLTEEQLNAIEHWVNNSSSNPPEMMQRYIPMLIAEIRRLHALLPDGVLAIAEERQLQVIEKGYTAEHDDEHDRGELTRAAIAYSAHSLCGCLQEREQFGFSEALILDTIAPWWPWRDEEFKPKDQTTDLQRAGAFIAAEIERLKRSENSEA